MLVAVGVVGVAVGLANAALSRLWGTVVAVLLVAAWFVYFAVLGRDGISHADMSSLGSTGLIGLMGFIVGTVVIGLFTRRRATP